ncbi:hypothetical protein G7D34_003712 [Salmonella enterica]|nr:hypothetical protein [Salmonella enterica]
MENLDQVIADLKQRVAILEAVAVAEAPETLQAAQVIYKAAQGYTGSAEGAEAI